MEMLLRYLAHGFQWVILLSGVGMALTGDPVIEAVALGLGGTWAFFCFVTESEESRVQRLLDTDN